MTHKKNNLLLIICFKIDIFVYFRFVLDDIDLIIMQILNRINISTNNYLLNNTHDDYKVPKFFNADPILSLEGKSSII